MFSFALGYKVVMKEYTDVVYNRFNKENEATTSIYSAYHPIGRYSRKILFKGLNKILADFEANKKPLSEIMLLDVGCGRGGMIEYFISKGFQPANCYGVDLSVTRFSKAKQQFPEVNFICGDALDQHFTTLQFDLITSFDLYSHFTTTEQILKGLQNANKSLAENGTFLWYDIYSKDHFKAPINSESWGFNLQQMKELAKAAGFEVISTQPFFKKFFGRYHSIYQAHRIPSSVLQLLESILPGTPGNILLVLKKKKMINPF